MPMSFGFRGRERKDTHAMKYAIDFSTGVPFRDARNVCKPGVTTLVVDDMMATRRSKWILGN